MGGGIENEFVLLLEFVDGGCSHIPFIVCSAVHLHKGSLLQVEHGGGVPEVEGGLRVTCECCLMWGYCDRLMKNSCTDKMKTNKRVSCEVSIEKQERREDSCK